MLRIAVVGLVALCLGLVAVREPVTFQSPYGFQFQVPSGWRAIPASGEPTTVVLLPEPPTPSSMREGFTVRLCGFPDPMTCLEPGSPAKLVQTSSSTLAGLPAQEYIFERWTTSMTRRWWDVVTMVTKDNQTYSVVGTFPALDAKRDWLLYNEIRQSFKIIPRTGMKKGVTPLTAV
jgi:hypothetical protein